MEKFSRFARIAETEFTEIVIATQDLGHKLRIYLIDKSFIDFFYTTQTRSKRFSIHWERSHIDKTIYRLDNMPDKKWKKISTYPTHFHFKSHNNVKVPPFESKPKGLENTFRNFLNFVNKSLHP